MASPPIDLRRGPSLSSNSDRALVLGQEAKEGGRKGKGRGKRPRTSSMTLTSKSGHAEKLSSVISVQRVGGDHAEKKREKRKKEGKKEREEGKKGALNLPLLRMADAWRAAKCGPSLRMTGGKKKGEKKRVRSDPSCCLQILFPLDLAEFKELNSGYVFLDPGGKKKGKKEKKREATPTPRLGIGLCVLTPRGLRTKSNR